MEHGTRNRSPVTRNTRQGRVFAFVPSHDSLLLLRASPRSEPTGTQISCGTESVLAFCLDPLPCACAGCKGWEKKPGG